MIEKTVKLVKDTIEYKIAEKANKKLTHIENIYNQKVEVPEIKDEDLEIN